MDLERFIFIRVRNLDRYKNIRECPVSEGNAILAKKRERGGDAINRQRERNFGSRVSPYLSDIPP